MSDERDVANEDEPWSPETPEEEIPQDPAIPGFDTVSHEHAPSPDEKDPDAERRERLDDTDQEGHMTGGELPS
jgi:hypothetical protein